MTKHIDAYAGGVRPKLWIADGDETALLDGRMLKSSIEAIEAIIASQAEFVLASARPRWRLSSIINETRLAKHLDSSLHIGAINGNYSFYKGALIRDRPLSAASVEEIIALYPHQEMMFFAAQKVTSTDPETSWMRWYDEKTGYGLRLQEGLPGKLYMIEVKVSPKTRSRSGKEYFAQQFTPTFAGMPEDAQWVQFTAHGDKLEMAIDYAERMGVELEEVACIGDGSNDETMIKHPSTLGIAMGQSFIEGEDVYKTRSAKEDGFAYAVEQVLRRAR